MATVAFRDTFFSADADVGKFNDPDARRLRYALYWSYVESNSYRNLHSWSTKMRADYGLYAYTRNIYNPAYRLIEFWATHLQGGALDPDAGNGEAIPSALPILIPEANRANEANLRRAVASLWRYSNWSVQKDIYTRWGSSLGDTAIEVVDDTERKKTYLRVVHPGLITSTERDYFGNVKGYVRAETRDDPERPGHDIAYKELVTRDGDEVVYQTYRDNRPYAWGDAEEWREPYGFVPLVLVQHLNMGLDWGWSELHAGIAKIREADDLTSTFDDQIRKLVNAPWLIAGLKKPDNTPEPTRSTATAARPEPGREEMPIVYAPPGASATSLVAPLDIAATSEHIQTILSDLERDYPELRYDRLRASGDASGTALRIARQPAETKVQQRRAGYDDGLVRAQMMAIAIGGYRGYPGFEGFSLDSYAAGALDHRIGDRPVFGVDIMERMEEDQARWNVVQTAHAALGQAGALAALREMGWDETKLAELQTAMMEQEQAQMNRFARELDRG